MIEVLLMVGLGLTLKKMAEGKGRPGKWGLLALAVPAVGWTASFFAGVIIAATTGATNLADTPYFWAVLGGTLLLELVVAAICYVIVKRLPPLATAPAAQAPAPPPPPPADAPYGTVAVPPAPAAMPEPIPAPPAPPAPDAPEPSAPEA